MKLAITEQSQQLPGTGGHKLSGKSKVVNGERGETTLHLLLTIRLDVKQEIHDIAILHHVFLAFDAHLALFLRT